MGVIVREKKKGSGVWWVYITHQGKRKAKQIGRDKAKADKIAKTIEAKLVLGQLNLDTEPTSPLFKDYAESWLENQIKLLRSRNTHERYQRVLEKHVFPKLGNKHINKVSRSDIRQVLLAVHNKGLSSSSVRLTRDVMSGVFCCAIDEEVLETNPVTNVLKRLGLEKKKKEPTQPLTTEEVQHFLCICLKFSPEFYPLFLCGFRTGMRLGELLALKWSVIDWNKRFIQVDKSYKRGEVSQTKTGKTRRVDLSDQLAETLKTLLIQRKREALKSGHGEEVEWIFHKNGKPISQNSVRNVFKRILKKAGIREIRVHDMRHTFASLLLSQGESPVYVKEQLGHHSIKITVDIYGHLIPSSNRQAVNQLDEQQPSATHTQPEKKESPKP